MEMKDIKAQMVDCCHNLWKRGLVANHDGNISFKLDSDRFLVTPTSFSKNDVGVEDLLLVDVSGKVLEGRHKIFGEFAWHLAIYKVRGDVSCVVHGHPPAAMGFGLSGTEIGVPGIPEAIVSLGERISNLGFFSPLDVALNNVNPRFEQDLARVLKDGDAFLAPGNGAWAVGQKVDQTYLRLELVEQIAKAVLAAKDLGGVKPLPRSLVEELLKKRPAVSVTSAANLNTTSSSSNTISPQDLRSLVQKELEKFLGK